jgi:MFS family permease
VVAVAIGPFSGRLVDRWDLRRALICTNLLQAVALLPLLAVQPDRLWPAYLVAVSQSLLTGVNNPAVMTVVPQLVARDQLIAANAASSSMQAVARLVGSPLGGVVVQSAGLRGVIVADGVSFLAVAAATWFVRADTSVAARRAATAVNDSPIADAVADAPIIGELRPRGRRALLASLGLSGVAQGMFLVLFLSFVVDDLHGQGAEVGLLRGVQAVGGVVGAVVIARVASRLDPVRLYAAGLFGMAAFSAVIWNGPNVTRLFVVYLMLFIVVGVPGVATNVGSTSVVQQAVPRDRLGRFSGQVGAVIAGGTAIGSLIVGGLLGRVERWALFNFQCAMYVLASLCAATITGRGSRSVRSSPAG